MKKQAKERGDTFWNNDNECTVLPREIIICNIVLLKRKVRLLKYSKQAKDET